MGRGGQCQAKFNNRRRGPRLYKQGDSYFVHARTVHSAEFVADCLTIEVFSDADRYNFRA
jgi:quercetin dioxygenase-like cupin family protein